MSHLFSSRRSIFLPVTALSFSAQQENDCANYLLKRSAHTELVPVSDAAQLTLTADGRLVENNYRFNVLGFTAVCAAISGGLIRVFSEISGESPSKLLNASEYSIPSAVSIYNEAMRVRFELLRERNMLVDHGARVVDGFLGLNHKLLCNSDFFTAIKAEMESNVPEAQFYRAELVGRELRVYVLDTSNKWALATESGEHTFATGWYFCNREDSGQSVKGFPCLYTRFGAALGASGRKNSLVHAGSDILGRATALISKTFSQQIDLTPLQARIFALRKFKLGFTDIPEDMEIATKKWVAYLINHGAPKESAKHIVKNTAVVGADLKPRDPLDVYTKKVLTERTGYDLVCAVLRNARNQPTYFREKLQAIALELLLPSKKRKRLGDG
jgi:hypothetical protein